MIESEKNDWRKAAAALEQRYPERYHLPTVERRRANNARRRGDKAWADAIGRWLESRRGARARRNAKEG